MNMRTVPEVVFHESALDAILAAGEEGVFARYRSNDLVVLVVDLRGTGLMALVCVAPENLAFGQEYWLGQTYMNWHLAYGLSTTNFKNVTKSLVGCGFEWPQIPYTIVNFGTGDFANAASARLDWNRNIFQTFVVPTSTVQAARAAIAASAPLVREFLYEPKTACGGVEARYGECVLEKLFDRAVYGYRRPVGLPVRTMSSCAEYLRSQIAQVDAAETDLVAGRLDRGTNWRWLTYRPIDYREFGSEHRALIAEINVRKSRLVEVLEMPHFYYELFLRRIDTSESHPQSSYSALRNDMDWTESLHAVSPGSFSPDFEERSALRRYVSRMQERYPFLAEDPLDAFLRKPKVRKWK